MPVNTAAFYIPGPDIHGERIYLHKPVSAIQLTQDQYGRTKLGLLTRMGAGTTVEKCGDGFNERTIKVRVDGQCYFIFVQDLEGQEVNYTLRRSA
jgi:hypothetical protein